MSASPNSWMPQPEHRLFVLLEAFDGADLGNGAAAAVVARYRRNHS